MKSVEELALPPATEGILAINNLQSSAAWSWKVIRRWPDRPGIAERVVEEEQYRLQFLGDVTALDRLAKLAEEFCGDRPLSGEAHLVSAQIASFRHHFAAARRDLDTAEKCGASVDAVTRLKLTIDQATGHEPNTVLTKRREMASASGDIRDLVPLGALLAELGEFVEADQAYLVAIQGYPGSSPFPPAWVCFQLGLLWGETAPVVDLDRAAFWYERAISYVPGYARARVHLAEIYLERSDGIAAEAALLPVRDSNDPEVAWRMSEVLVALDRCAEATRTLENAKTGYNALLLQHKLAFADHASEFYLGAGANPAHACTLAVANLMNRPTLRAFELAHRAAVASAERGLEKQILARARERWGSSKAFATSTIARLSEILAPNQTGAST